MTDAMSEREKKMSGTERELRRAQLEGPFSVVIYSDAEWTELREPPWFSKGLGGILWCDDFAL